MEEREKDTFIRIRIDSKTKEQFQSLCMKKAINSSLLIRQLIQQWMTEQLDAETKSRRKTDIQ